MGTTGIFWDQGGAVYNAAAYGSLGTADDTSTIQAAINAAHTAGGGRVVLPAGTFLVSTLTIYSAVWLRGAGYEATVLKQKNNANSDRVIETNDFATLHNSNSTGGEFNFALFDLSIDGNVANQTAGNGDGIDIYGYGYTLSNLRIHHCRGAALYSQWSTSNASPGHDAMAAYLNNLALHDSNNGLYFQGPHDSMAGNIDCWNNTNQQMYLDSIVQLVTVHCWEGVTNGQPNLIVTPNASESILANIVSEGTIGAANILMQAGSVILRDAHVFAAGATASGTYGIQIGDTAHGVSGLLISSMAHDFNATGQSPLYFANDSGGGNIIDQIQWNNTASYTGTKAPATQLRTI